MTGLARVAALVGLGVCAAGCAEAPGTAPVEQPYYRSQLINAHFHSAFLEMDDAAYRRDVIEEMDAHGIAVSVLHLNEESDLADWVDTTPGRFLAGPSFPCWENVEGRRFSCHWRGEAFPDLDWLRANYESGRLKVMGEMLFVYAGISPTDPRMAPYWALAAELKIPVGVHINRGPPPGPIRPEGCCPDFDPDLGNPELLRPVLERYPGLKIWLQHTGFPALPILDDIDYLDETYRLLRDFPNVYVDMTALNSAVPQPVHEAAVRAFVERGFADRIMFGSDNWEVAPILQRYENYSFLTARQKHNILYGNASRFFGLDRDGP